MNNRQSRKSDLPEGGEKTSETGGDAGARFLFSIRNDKDVNQKLDVVSVGGVDMF